MNSVKSIKWFLLLLALTFVAACGGNSSNNSVPGDVNTVTTSPAGTYSVTYTAGTGTMAPSEGKTTFQIRVVQRSDGSAAAGLANSITLNPMMNGMGHSAPVDVISESGTEGTYNCTIYYLMGGDWQLDVKIGSETATFYPSVASAKPGDDTTKKSMYGTSDIVSGGTSTQYNSYFLFNDGMVSAGTPTLKLYIAQTLDNKMSFNPVSTVSSPTGTVESALVTASTDSTFVTGTVTASDDGNGHWSMPGISDLLTAGTYTVYVKLNVDGENKAVNGTIPYAAFKVTSH